MKPALSVLALLFVAGCLSPAAEEAAPAAEVADVLGGTDLRLDDATGDAFEWSAEGIARFGLCGLVCPETTSAPAAPYFDIVSASYLGETTTSLHFALEIAELDAAFPQLDGAMPPMHRVAAYRLCFAPDAEAPERCAGADVYEHKGELAVFGRLSIVDPSCNEWGMCEHAIPVTLTPGAPARLDIEVPKALALRAEDPRIESISASASWSAYHPVWPWWHAAVTIHDPQLGHQHKHVVPMDYMEVADVLDATPVEIDWTPPVELTFPRFEGPVMPLAPGNSIGDGSQFDEAQLDLLDLDLHEEAGELIVTMRFAELPEDPGHDIQHILMFGIEGKDVYEIGWLHVGGKSYGYAGHCISFECAGEHEDGLLAEHDATGHGAMDTEAEVTTGAPGTIVIRAPFSAFPTIGAGDRTNFLWVMTQHSDFGEWQGSYDAGAHRDVHKMSFIDLRFGGETYVFTEGNPEPADAHTH